MSNKSVLIAGVFVFMFLASTGGEAKEYKIIKLEPGNYEFSETSSTTQKIDNVERVTERCLTKDQINPAGVLAEKDGCIVSNYKSKGDTMSFDFLCDRGPGTSRVDGSATYSGGGKEFSWTKVVKTQMSDDLSFSINSKGKAVRKGDCKSPDKQDKE